MGAAGERTGGRGGLSASEAGGGSGGGRDSPKAGRGAGRREMQDPRARATNVRPGKPLGNHQFINDENGPFRDTYLRRYGALRPTWLRCLIESARMTAERVGAPP